MEKIIAYKCNFCRKITETNSGMYKHEKKCFKNPNSKSCITCKYLDLTYLIDGRILTEQEQKIFNFEVPGTFHSVIGIFESDYSELNDEYKYLYESEIENYCTSQKFILKKLRTQCNHHGNKEV